MRTLVSKRIRREAAGHEAGSGLPPTFPAFLEWTGNLRGVVLLVLGRRGEGKIAVAIAVVGWFGC
jgi:hypothetical protein